MSDDVKDTPEEFDGSETIELGPENIIRRRAPNEENEDSQPEGISDDSSGEEPKENFETAPTGDFPSFPGRIPSVQMPLMDDSAESLKKLTYEPPSQLVDKEEVENPEATGSPVDGGFGNRRYLIFLTILILTGFLAWIFPDPGWRPKEAMVDSQMEIGSGAKSEAQQLETVTTMLYVPDKNVSNLEIIEHPVNMPQELEGKIRIVLEGLFADSNAQNVIFPKGVEVRGVYVYKSTAAISLGGEFRKVFHVGARTELLAVYSIVNTVCHNFKQIKQIRILVDDVEEEIFVSHVDISRPLGVDNTFVVKTKKSVKKTSSTNVKPESKKETVSGGKHGG
ncbi:MAG: GerMN domain-containing protein [Nitrospinota bacterium]|nr:GerMN domain-containing protein [Nitrospinota bacterium]MDH5756475.1 GerMN domain-containing protein [Nitrospinota bacterium]